MTPELLSVLKKQMDLIEILLDHAEQDKATIGEMAARLNTLDGEMAELRDEVHGIAGRYTVPAIEVAPSGALVWCQACRYGTNLNHAPDCPRAT